MNVKVAFALFIVGLFLCMDVVAADCINVYVKDNNGNPRANVAVNLDYYWMQGTTNGMGICLSIITISSIQASQITGIE